MRNDLWVRLPFIETRSHPKRKKNETRKKNHQVRLNRYDWSWTKCRAEKTFVQCFRKLIAHRSFCDICSYIQPMCVCVCAFGLICIALFSISVCCLYIWSLCRARTNITWPHKLCFTHTETDSQSTEHWKTAAYLSCNREIASTPSSPSTYVYDLFSFFFLSFRS